MLNHLDKIIDSAADEADTILDGVRTPAEAKPILREWLADNHQKLSAAEQNQVIDEVLALLDEEDFFSATAGGEADDGGEDAGEADE
jgi:hypothetical protein